jgi:alpha-L-rhamnosidase
VGSFSFNHYAFGCVGDWLVRHIGGLTPMEPGYRKFRVEPHYIGQLKHAETNYDSVYGNIRVKWRVQDENQMSLHVKVPANTLVVISLTNVCPVSIQELNDYVIEMGYSNVQYHEDEKKFEFTAGSGQVDINWKLHDSCQMIKKEQIYR